MRKLKRDSLNEMGENQPPSIPCKKKYLTNPVRNVDIFAKGLNFTYKGSEYYKTFCGGIFTLIIVIILVVIFFMRL